MPGSRKKAESIDAYIKDYPKEVQEIMQKLRRIVKEIAPEAEETISYAIPTFKLNGTYLVYFAGFDKHIGVYPIPKGDAKFQKEIAPLVKGKGTIQFPLDKPIPYDLFQKFVKFSLQENLERANKN